MSFTVIGSSTFIVEEEIKMLDEFFFGHVGISISVSDIRSRMLPHISG